MVHQPSLKEYVLKPQKKSQETTFWCTSTTPQGPGDTVRDGGGTGFLFFVEVVPVLQELTI